MEVLIESTLAGVARYWQVAEPEVREYLYELEASSEFYQELNQKIVDVPGFADTTFTRPQQLRTYRCLLYLFTRVHRPQLFVETGVQHGFSSSLILLAMKANQRGKLVSIDIPPDDPRMAGQGSFGLPAGKTPGWIIPDNLKQRHELHLAPAEQRLPDVLDTKGELDVFLHDSDHSYCHMMFEMALAWKYLSVNGMLIVDNVEQNDAFKNFCRGVDESPMTVSSFEGTDRTWQHGFARKSRPIET